ncbi:hypothetical protein GYMLUDRAFT_245364 [Collybiopsis luxurians FD-317 M1]|uniref:F-box domain-containing protein n=1 Tax=Collybiopsis luxurians FD-317 M1 TaxID=944289 RepID=A0A0D0C9Z0_9AGAR|nr:hypothetical protein GYMLUDRAFT_245364 [Collybiopsis luxurians FD-317 M1]
MYHDFPACIVCESSKTKLHVVPSADFIDVPDLKACKDLLTMKSRFNDANIPSFSAEERVELDSQIGKADDAVSSMRARRMRLVKMLDYWKDPSTFPASFPFPALIDETKNGRRCPVCQLLLDSDTGRDFSLYPQLFTNLPSSKPGRGSVSPVERSEVDSFIARANQEIQKYTESITQLVHQCMQLKEIQDLYISLSSPIRNLPPDILIEIFKHVITSKPTRFINRAFQSTPNWLGPIFGLTWVCSWWREIILSHRALWSRAEIFLIFIYDITNVKEVFRKCLLRAGSETPLYLTLNLSQAAQTFDTSEVLEFLGGEYAGRWKELEIDMDYLENVAPTLDALCAHSSWDNATAVERLTVRFHAPNVQDLPGIFQKASPLPRKFPRLRYLEIPHLYTSDILDLGNLQVLNILGDYHIDGPGALSLVVLFEKCPQLKKLSLGRILRAEREGRGNEFSVTLKDPLVHTSLSALSINCVDDRCGNSARFGGIWELIRLPNLEDLSVSVQASKWENVEGFMDGLKRVLIDSGCVLRKMSLDLGPFLGDGNGAIGDSFLQGLNIKGDEGGLTLATWAESRSSQP